MAESDSEQFTWDEFINVLVQVLKSQPRLPDFATVHSQLHETLASFTDSFVGAVEAQKDLAALFASMLPRRDVAFVLPPFETAIEYPPIAVTISKRSVWQARIDLPDDWDREAARKRVVQLTFWFFLLVGIAITSANEEIVDRIELYAGGAALGVACMARKKAGEFFDKKFPPDDQ